MQRFALATLYYSTDGGNWSDGGWLESNHECDWGDSDDQFADLTCSQESAIQELNLFQDNLSGRIPIELALLTLLTHLELFSNQLTGFIPSEIGLLTQLTLLSLWQNQLMGSIPSEFGLLTQLMSLFLFNNELTGPLPSELGILTQLTELWLYNNELTGSMPSSFCSADLRPFIDCGEITCTCCACV